MRRHGPLPRSLASRPSGPRSPRSRSIRCSSAVRAQSGSTPESSSRKARAAAPALSQFGRLAIVLPAVAQAKWLNSPRMHEARAGHGAALLPDGRVLVLGGWSDAAPVLATTEV